MNTWMSAAAYWLVNVYAMATVVLVAALITLRSIGQPARRLVVARWTMRVLLCVPLLAILTKSTSGAGAVPDLAPADPTKLCDCAVSGATPSGRMPALVTIYATCSGLVVTWLAIGALAAARLVARSTEASASLQTLLKQVVTDGSTSPRLRVGNVSQPVALGLFRPTILLPDWFVETETKVGIEAALTHEWAHLRGGDLWMLATSRLLFVVFFAHPLFYVLRGRIRADQEVIADAEAARPNGKVAYAEALVGWARRTSVRPIGSSLALLGRSSLLRKRVALLLDAEFRVEPGCPLAWMVAVRASAVALVIGLGTPAWTGMARTALSAVAPVTPRSAPHVHPSNARAFACPSGSDSPSRQVSCEPSVIGCDDSSK